MKRRLALLACCALIAAPLTAPAAESAPKLTPAETAFVARVTADLTKRFATPAAAEKAGYARYTNEDESGAISYANRKWVSTDPAVPAQLWYDVHGRLIGADYSVLQADHPTAPALFGLLPARFSKIGAHIHYVVKNGDGTLGYDKDVSAKAWTAAGLDLQHPTAEGLVKVGKVTSASEVTLVFLYPSIWDVGVWLIPNPNGAFAELNPNLKP